MLNGLHLVLAVVLMFVSLLAHGRVPGLSADESAALGFLFFFGVGLPALLIGVVTLALSVYVAEKSFGVLAAMLLVTTALALLNVWTGLFASLGYLAFGVRVLVRRDRG